MKIFFTVLQSSWKNSELEYDKRDRQINKLHKSYSKYSVALPTVHLIHLQLALDWCLREVLAVTLCIVVKQSA